MPPQQPQPKTNNSTSEPSSQEALPSPNTEDNLPVREPATEDKPAEISTPAEIIEENPDETPPATEPIQSEPKSTPEPESQQPILQPSPQNIPSTPPNNLSFIQNLLTKARAKIQDRKQKKLDKIIALFETKPQITNQDIQKLLRISRATSFRYLDILEKQNKIKQVGNTGKAVFYSKN